jgi:rhomboid protease GluP
MDHPAPDSNESADSLESADAAVSSDVARLRDSTRDRHHPSRVSWRSRFRQLPTTYSLIAITLLVFIAQLVAIEIEGFDAVLFYGSKHNDSVMAGEVWRLVTPIFIHVGVWHIFVNMYSLYALGPAIERIFGHPRMLVMYLLSGISGVIFSLIFSPHRSVGASGAIFGLLGALGTFLYRHRGSFGQAGRIQLRQILIITILNLGLGLMPQIDNWGHLGGLVAGTLLTWSAGPLLEVIQMDDRPARFIDQRPWSKAWPTAIIAFAILVVLAFASTFSPFVR